MWGRGWGGEAWSGHMVSARCQAQNQWLACSLAGWWRFSTFPSHFSQVSSTANCCMGWSREHLAFDPEQLIFHRTHRELGRDRRKNQIPTWSELHKSTWFPGLRETLGLGNPQPLGPLFCHMSWKHTIFNTFLFLDVVPCEINWVKNNNKFFFQLLLSGRQKESKHSNCPSRNQGFLEVTPNREGNQPEFEQTTWKWLGGLQRSNSRWLSSQAVP